MKLKDQERSSSKSVDAENISSSESSENKRAYSVGACKCHFINRLPQNKTQTKIEGP